MAGFAGNLLLLLSGFLGAVAPVDASTFLRAQSHGDAERLATQAVQQTLLWELSALGHGESMLLELQADLRPMFVALPKNELGKLDASTVRYALHRFFVQKRGWYVKGLEPSGGAWNASSPASVMTDRVPSYIQGLFEERVHGHGLGLEELAAFAATLQDLVHEEEVAHLIDAYGAMNLSTQARMNPEAVDEAIKRYLMIYLLGPDALGAGTKKLKTLERAISKIYPAWPDTSLWALDVRRSVAHARRAVRNPFVNNDLDFAQIADVVREIGHRFGAFQDHECRSLKDALVGKEYRGSGRVRLSDFYSGTLGGEWQFSESMEYLRDLGALDETDKSRPSVVIPNYIISQSNCLASSSFYSVCCLDECEGLLGHLEQALSAPSAEPARIAELVAQLPSDTVDAPRNLSAELRLRLDEIAHLHSGQVPLHGRLFAQWMHHAYPRECPFPHAAGATNPMTPDEWMASQGSDSAVASRKEMQQHVATGNATYVATEDVKEALPWTTIEELVVMAPSPRRGQPLWTSLPQVVLLASFACLVAPLALHGSRSVLFASEPKLPRYNV